MRRLLLKWYGGMKIIKKGLFCILICMLVILTAVFPISSTTSWKQTSHPRINTNIQYSNVENIFNDLKVKLEKVTTKQKALVCINEAIVTLHEQGLLPKGMSIQRAQRLVTMGFLKNEYLHPSQESDGNDMGNTNCLVVGMTNHFIFRPFPTILDIPIIYYLLTNSSLQEELNFLLWFYAIRYFSPLKFGPFAFAGSRAIAYENGNVTKEWNFSSSGWVWTIGMNGVQKWNGTFYGGLFTRYRKYVYNNYSYTDAWDPVGIKGFVGVQPFCFLSSMDYDSNRFYIGFAREVNFTYSPPWT